VDSARARREAGGDLVSRAARRLAGAWPGPVTVGEVLVAMPEHAVFRSHAPDGTDVVVKADLSAPRAAAERAVTAAAYRTGLPVPHIVYADSGVPALLVLRHVPGPALTSAAPEEAWTDAGRTLARLHELPDPGGLQASMDGRAHWGVGGRTAPAPGPRPEGPGPLPQGGWPLPEGPGPLPEVLAGLAARESADAARRGLLTAGQAGRLSSELGAFFAATAEPDRYRVLHGDSQPDHFLLADRPGAGRAGSPR
jgi:hypothetical protein